MPGCGGCLAPPINTLERFTETGANLGSLGVFEAKFLMRHMQANAKAFDKYGA